jgi:hypothetical protein
MTEGKGTGTEGKSVCVRYVHCLWFKESHLISNIFIQIV